MLGMSRITAILHLYSQVTDIIGNVIVQCINIRLLDLLALFHYICIHVHSVLNYNSGIRIPKGR